MKILLLLSVFFLVSCSGESRTSYSLNCEGTFTTISRSANEVSRQNRKYEIDDNSMSERNCTKDGAILNCYKETELPNYERVKEQFVYNTGDYALSEAAVKIGVDRNTGKPIFISTEIFRATCPMTVKRKS